MGFNQKEIRIHRAKILTCFYTQLFQLYFALLFVSIAVLLFKYFEMLLRIIYLSENLLNCNTTQSKLYNTYLAHVCHVVVGFPDVHDGVLVEGAGLVVKNLLPHDGTHVQQINFLQHPVYVDSLQFSVIAADVQGVHVLAHLRIAFPI